MVRWAQPMPAELTSTRSGPISLAISTAAMMSSVFVTSTCAEGAADLVGELVALVLLEVGDDDLGPAGGEHAGSSLTDALTLHP